MNPEQINTFLKIHQKMVAVGFSFEKEQIPRLQRREKEEKFIHPCLIERLKHDGYKVNAKKFYIKPISDEPSCEIGFVTGKTSPLAECHRFAKPNAIDTHNNAPAWVNRGEDISLDRLLQSIDNYLDDREHFPESIDPNDDIYEGAKKTIVVNRYERNAIARMRCLEHNGFCCKVCAFDFQKQYGDIGKRYIHVHHIIPLHTIGEDYKLDYKKDLVPVCPNCHAMLHRKFEGTTLSVNELRRRIRQMQNA